MNAKIAAAVALGAGALLFFAAERCLSVFSWSRLEELTVPRSRRNAAERCLEERELVSTAFLVVGGAALSALSAVLAAGASSPWPAAGQAAVIALFLVWVLPEAAAWKFSDRIVLYLVPVLSGIVSVPFRAIRTLAPRQSAEAPARPGNAESHTDASPPDAEAHEFLRMAVRLQHTQVREIMTPRTEMVGVPDTATLREAADVCRKSGYSRIPVYRGNRDQIIGILHVKDLLAWAGTDKWEAAALVELAREPFFIPETKTISELLAEFQRTRTHMGIVLDEYGGTSGLVTLEDVVEELIGEIHDEHEAAHSEPPLFKRLGERTVEAQAVMRIEEFNEEFGLDLPEEEDFDTLGGFVTFVLGKIPEVGESFEYGGARFTVLDADARHVIRVRVDLGERAMRQKA